MINQCLHQETQRRNKDIENAIGVSEDTQNNQPVFKATLRFTEQVEAFYQCDNEEELKARLEETFTAKKLPDYKIINIEKVADNMEQFKMLMAAKEAETKTVQ